MEDFTTLLALVKTVGDNSTKNDSDLLKLISTLTESVVKLTDLVISMDKEIDYLKKEITKRSYLQ